MPPRAGLDGVMASSSAKAAAVDASAAAEPKATREGRGHKGFQQTLATKLPDGPTPTSAGVVYVGHLPKGFYEEAMTGFFAQFGTVTRVKVARSKKTGRAKGYAFVEFRNVEVSICFQSGLCVLAKRPGRRANAASALTMSPRRSLASLPRP